MDKDFPISHDGPTLARFLARAEDLAREAGKVLLDLRGTVAITEKGPKDLVTEADLRVQELLQTGIQQSFPDHEFLGEEDTGTRPASKLDGYCWVVDPLDGTTNYAHQLPAFSVSIALVKDGTPVVAVVYDPSLDEIFTASEGGVARMNGDPISVSPCQSMRQALVAASLPAEVDRRSVEVTRFLEVLQQCQALRRLGSAALNLAYVAAGRLDAYWATSVKIWDVAAGFLLIECAGGVVTGHDGGPLDLKNPKFAAAATPELHQSLIQLLERAESEHP